MCAVDFIAPVPGLANEFHHFTISVSIDLKNRGTAELESNKR